MLSRLTKNTRWYIQKSLITTRFGLGSQKNEKNDKTQSVSKNHLNIKEDGKNQFENIQSQKGNNLQKINQDKKNPNGAESNQVGSTSQKDDYLRQILKNQQTFRVQQAQRRQQQAQRKQQQAQRKQQQAQRQQQQAKKSVKRFWINTVVVAAVGISVGYSSWQVNKRSLEISKQTNERQQQKRKSEIKHSPEQLKKQSIYKFGTVNPVLNNMDNWLMEKDFSNNQTRIDLKKIMFYQMQSNARLRVITGIPGNGKTTEIKRLVKQLRKQGHIVYYLNLRNESDAKNLELSRQRKIKQVNDLFELLSIFYSQYSRPSQGKLVYAIIDDINMLESSENTPDLASQIKLFWIKLACVSQMETHRAIVISSSSSYVTALKKKSYIRKESAFSHLKMKTDEEMNQSIKNIFNFNFKGKQTDSSQYKEKIQYFVKKRYTLRQVMQIVPKFQELFGDVLDDKNFFQKLKAYQQQSIQWEYHKIGKSILEKCNKLEKQSQKYNKIMLSEILKLDNYDEDNCFKIYKKLPQIKKGFYVQNQQSLDEILEANNLLFYCYPRTENSRRVLERILANME